MIQVSKWDIIKNTGGNGIEFQNQSYLRKWEVLINIQGKGESSAIKYDVSSLHCAFQIEEKCTTGLTNSCTLQVFNLNHSTVNRILNAGDKIKISAGYEGDKYGVIFEGDIVQSFINYQNGVDEIVQILAIKGDRVLSNKVIRGSLVQGSTPRERAELIANKADFKLGDTPNLDKQKQQLARGKIFWGQALDYIKALGKDIYNSFFEYIEDKKPTINLPDANKKQEGNLINLNYTNGLVGHPIFSSEGIQIKCLLDSRIKPNTFVQIDNNSIQRQYGGLTNGLVASQESMYDKDGIYRILSIRHTGDTHTSQWQTEAIGIPPNKQIILLDTEKK